MSGARSQNIAAAPASTTLPARDCHPACIILAVAANAAAGAGATARPCDRLMPMLSCSNEPAYMLTAENMRCCIYSAARHLMYLTSLAHASQSLPQSIAARAFPIKL